VDEIKHDLVREAMRLTGVERGVEIVTLADIPSSGSGLGSSSTLTVGVLHALHVYRGESVDTEQLAREACHIEINVLGKPIGKQDQYISAYGSLRQITFHPDERVICEKIDLNDLTKKELNESLMLFYTGIARMSEDILSEQEARIQETAEILKQMKNQVPVVKNFMQKGKPERLGTILNEAWEMKKQLACGITNPEINSLYEQAMAAGALGGKITGAGGGGFLLIYCPNERQEAVRSVLSGYRELKFGLEERGSSLLFNSAEE